jgi:hypothetical protein
MWAFDGLAQINAEVVSFWIGDPKKSETKHYSRKAM